MPVFEMRTDVYLKRAEVPRNVSTQNYMLQLGFSVTLTSSKMILIAFGGAAGLNPSLLPDVASADSCYCNFRPDRRAIAGVYAAEPQDGARVTGKPQIPLTIGSCFGPSPDGPRA